jgi:2-C-methyl-D-erythritol 2,4-cyclodiphosphate synthase
MRVGIGYDVHQLIPGRKLVLGGVTVPFSKGLSGHSDADVLIHAIMDALLGAAGLKDIGHQFPGEPKYKDISSILLLSKVKIMLDAKGFHVNNLDATIVAQAPKLAPLIDDMRNNISRILDVNFDNVMIKATTTDGLGYIGNGEGITALAIASITTGN